MGGKKSVLALFGIDDFVPLSSLDNSRCTRRLGSDTHRTFPIAPARYPEG